MSTIRSKSVIFISLGWNEACGIHPSTGESLITTLNCTVPKCENETNKPGRYTLPCHTRKRNILIQTKLNASRNPSPAE